MTGFGSYQRQIFSVYLYGQFQSGDHPALCSVIASRYVSGHEGPKPEAAVTPASCFVVANPQSFISVIPVRLHTWCLGTTATPS
jgi:hypothetical protein